jgi:iron complex outermembrane receptor protein
LFPDPDIRASVIYGSWNTRVLQLDGDSGFFGPGSKNSFLMNIQQLLSDGYQTYNRQKRVAGYGKYQYRLNSHSSLTLYGGLVDIWTNTPNTTNPTRAQVAQYGDTSWTALHCWRTELPTRTITGTAPTTCKPILNTPTSTMI